jgi:hypothetical protein
VIGLTGAGTKDTLLIDWVTVSTKLQQTCSFRTECLKESGLKITKVHTSVEEPTTSFKKGTPSRTNQAYTLKARYGNYVWSHGDSV